MGVPIKHLGSKVSKFSFPGTLHSLSFSRIKKSFTNKNRSSTRFMRRPIDGEVVAELSECYASILGPAFSLVRELTAKVGAEQHGDVSSRVTLQRESRP